MYKSFGRFNRNQCADKTPDCLKSYNQSCSALEDKDDIIAIIIQKCRITSFVRNSSKRLFKFTSPNTIISLISSTVNIFLFRFQNRVLSQFKFPVIKNIYCFSSDISFGLMPNRNLDKHNFGNTCFSETVVYLCLFVYFLYCKFNFFLALAIVLSLLSFLRESSVHPEH